MRKHFKGPSLLPWVVDNLLLDHVELPHVLDLAVHLVNLVSWIVKVDHSKTFFNISTSLLEHSFIVKSGWVANGILVTAPVSGSRERFLTGS